MKYKKPSLLCAAMLLASCAWPESSNWHLMDEGYAIDAKTANEVSVEVHLNQLKALGGEVNTPQFRQFIAERLKWHGMCPSGWAPLPCAEDGSCLERTRRSVTVPGRCTES
jgi:hypothetical protein